MISNLLEFILYQTQNIYIVVFKTQLLSLRSMERKKW